MGADEGRQVAPLGLAQQNARRVSDAEDRLDELVETVEALQAENQRLKNEVARLRQEVTEQSGRSWRVGRYVKTLLEQARRNPNGDGASLEVSEGLAAVNGSVDRSRVYDDYEHIQEQAEAGKLPGDVRYQKESRGADRNSRLVLSGLDESAWPREIGGVVLTEEGGL